MRLSVTTLWVDLKLRLIVTGLILAVGFYGGLIHKVLTQAFWPGTEALAGLIFFLGLGVLLGLHLPRIGKRSIPRLKPGLLNTETNPVAFAGLMFTLLAAIVLITILLGSLITRALASGAPVLPERFVLNHFSWRLIAFLIPLLPAGLVGIIFGFILILAFTIFIYRDCPNHLRSEQPEVQSVISSLLILIFLGFGITWPVGFYLAEIFLDRWFILVLVPMIACLATMLVSLLETAGEAYYLKQIWSRANILYTSFPEVAGRASLWASLSICLLGGLMVWNTVHWTYAISNWFAAAPIGPDQPIGINIPAVIAATIGIRIGFHVAARKARGTSVVDLQGSALSILGLCVILASVIVNHVLKAGYIVTLYPQIVIPLVLIGLAFLWGGTFGVIVPALAMGRPSRFDVWIEIISKTTLGAMAAGILSFVWQHWGAGNLLAIALGSLLAIAFGGTIIIYNEPRPSPARRKGKSVKAAHFTTIGILYLSLIFITIIVPHLKYSWLIPTLARDLTINEGRAGVAFFNADDPIELAWANRVCFPERINPALRTQNRSILRQIIRTSAEEKGASVRVLLTCMPFMPDGVFSALPVQQLDQFDIDRSLRALEFKHLNIDPNTSTRDWLDLSCCQRPYDVVIAMIPTPWPRGQTWPNASFFLRRLCALARSPRGVWLISLTSDDPGRSGTNTRFELIHNLMGNLTASELQSQYLDGVNGIRWYVCSPSSSVHRLTNLNETGY